MGGETDDRLGSRKRASRTVGLQTSGMGQRAAHGAPDRAGEGSARLRSARLDAEHQRNGHCQSASSATARAPVAGPVDFVLCESKSKRAREDRADRQSGSARRQLESAGKTSDRRTGSTALWSKRAAVYFPDAFADTDARAERPASAQRTADRRTARRILERQQRGSARQRRWPRVSTDSGFQQQNVRRQQSRADGGNEQ